MTIEAQLRIKAFPHLPGSDFDDVLTEAQKYHDEHPPLEEGLVGDISEPLPEDGRHRQPMVDWINQVTLRNMLDEHRDKLVDFFRKKDVPEDLGAEIVDMLVLHPPADKPKPPEQ